MPPKKIQKTKCTDSPKASTHQMKKVKANTPIFKSEFQEINEWAKKACSIQINTCEWIDPQLVTYNGLENISRFPLYENKVLIMQSRKYSEQFLDILEEAQNSIASNTYYFLGPSGVGKSYDLIQTVFQIRKNYSHIYRVLHVILNEGYTNKTFDWFPKDFIYCFCNDFDDKEFPNPPKNLNHNDKSKGENWFNYLTNECLKNVNFLNEIRTYFIKKGIKIILIWDQDNILQRKRVEIPKINFEFLNSLKNSSLIHFTLISASNNNEGFKNVNFENGSKIIESNEGFSKKDTINFIDIMKKIIKIDFDIDYDLIFNYTNGNGYLISRFNQTLGKTFHDKLISFINDISDEMNSKMKEFFILKLKNENEIWKQDFPEIIKYLDQEIKIPIGIRKGTDKNFTYITKEGFLKSTCSLAKKIFVDFYLEQSNIYENNNNISNRMWRDMMNQKNAPLKGWMFENFVIKKFSSKLGKQFKLKCQEKMSNGRLNEKSNDFSFEFTEKKYFSTIEEINEIITDKSQNYLLIPYSEMNNLFDFLIWNGQKENLYVYQITINEQHKKSDKLFFQIKNFNKYKIKENQIKFFWITLKDKILTKIMMEGSLLIEFEEYSIQNEI